ncbi:hypothetical protein V8F33_013430 [Rhypophila sp. PSN 637]
MNLLNWIAGAGHRRDRRMREERRHLRRRRDDVHEIYPPPGTHWPEDHPHRYTYRHSTEQEPRIIFVSPGPEDLADHESSYYHQHHRRHQRRRRERVHYTPPERPQYAADIPENWYRQQYSPPLPDPEPEYENHHTRRRLYLDNHGPRNRRPASPALSAPSSPRSTWSFTCPKAGPPPIYNLETQRALEESYSQAALERHRERDRSRDRFSSSSPEIPIVDELDERLRREERRRQRDVVRRDSVDQERRHRIAELQAEIQARELQQELRDRGRELEGDRDRRRRPSSGGRGYRSPSVSDVNGLADRLEDVDLHRGRRSPSPYREREQYVGSLGGNSWTGSGCRRRFPSREGLIQDSSERGRDSESYYLRPRVRFSPAVNYEPDFVRRPRVYFRSAEPDDLYGDGDWANGRHW